ncbi:MAG TPA: hypothetical protein VNL96_11535 [Gemmatimonadaceae bacterium]|nr:hypothetical protein [Gemmatimonadaceae bacterium]
MEEIRSMRREGLSITDIAELTGFDRKTVRKWLREPGAPRYGPRASRHSKLAPYTAYLDERLSAGVWNAVILLRELRERGYEASTKIQNHASPRSPCSWSHREHGRGYAQKL